MFDPVGYVLIASNIPCRSMPQLLPAWMVVLETTLGCRQGTLYKAPRNADKELKDSNTFVRNMFWTTGVNKPSVPLAPSPQSAFIPRDTYLFAVLTVFVVVIPFLPVSLLSIQSYSKAIM